MNDLKKYTLHILAIRAIDSETFDLPPEQNAVIVCTDRSNPCIDLCLPENILILNFPDVEDAAVEGAFCAAHAKRLIRFLRNLSPEVTDLYVCCSKGGSRSPAVAAAILRMSGRSDKAVWCNPFYVPNKLVYRILCREYGLFATRFSVQYKAWRNDRAFKMAQSGKPCKYERWQILH